MNLDLPVQGQGSSPFRETIRQLTESGYQPLVGLGTATPWAADRSHRTYVHRGMQFDFQENDDGEMVRTVTDPDTGDVLGQSVISNVNTLPPADVARYEEYVEAVVSELTEDYGVRYFVLTNEPTPELGTSTEEWVDKIIKPASAIIRAHGAKVVWGALPAGGRYEWINELLNYNEAWRDIDVLDVHYWPPQGFQWMWEDWVKTGKIGGLWQSEVGAGISRLQVANYYPRFLRWALTHGWSEENPDRYKLFYYKLLIVLAIHLPTTDSVLYIDHANRELINLGRREFKQDRFVEVLVPNVPTGRVATAEAVSVEGARAPATVQRSGRDTIVRVDPFTVIVPGRSFDLVRESPYTFYVDLHLR